MKRLALVLLAGCWTGSDARTAAPEPARPGAPPTLEISLERGPCLGTCPVFKLVIRDSGRVDWLGEAHVAAIGARSGRISRTNLESLDQEVDLARFFARDRYGRIPHEPICVRRGNTRSCTFTSDVICSHTSHTILTVRRGRRSHRIDLAHCSDEDAALDELESRIIGRAGADEWIGHP